MNHDQVRKAHAALTGLDALRGIAGVGLTMNTARAGGAGATHRLLSSEEGEIVRTALTQYYEGILAELGVTPE